MSCNSQVTCEGCSCDGKRNLEPIDIENCEIEVLEWRKRILELESKLNTDSTQLPASEKRTKTAILRSSYWFNDESNPGNTALYVKRYLNYGMTKEELMSGKPVIGIAQSGSDLVPCNRHHLELVKRVREGIRTAGGIAFEFPTHPIQESTRRPTACLDRNLAYLGLVEVLHGYPLDGVVLLTGCDKTTPAALMAAATVNIPAICLNVGPIFNGYKERELVGSGAVIWKAREMYAAGDLDKDQLLDYISKGAPSVGHCNTMGTASNMNALAEALGMALLGSTTIPTTYRERAQCSYETGIQIVEMIKSDRKPSDIMTRAAFENAIVTNTAIGGSTNAPIHINAIAQHIGVDVSLDDWDQLGFHIPLLLNMQPAGELLGENYFRAGGLPAIMAELLDAGKLNPGVLTCNGLTIAENVRGKNTWDHSVIRPYHEPLIKDAGFIHLRGSLFDSAIMKTSVISKEFREMFLSDPEDPNAFEGPVAVFDGPEDYHRRLDYPSTSHINEVTILVMRGAGPLGYPGAAEVVNMHPPGRLLQRGIRSLPCIGDGRQSGISGAPSILNASPEAAANGNLAILQDGDRLRVDLSRRRVDILVCKEELVKRQSALAKRVATMRLKVIPRGKRYFEKRLLN